MSTMTDLGSMAGVVTSGATIAVGGFQLNRVPIALLRAIGEHRRTGLACVSAPNPLALEILAAAGCIRSAECGFIGFQYEDGFVIAPAVRRALAAGDMSLNQPDVYDTIRSLRDAADGDDPRADFALLHAQQADADGNLQIDDPYVDVELASASRNVLATVEAVVDKLDEPTIPARKVSHVAVVENGAAPTSCLGRYRHDAGGVRRLIGVDPHHATEPVDVGIASGGDADLIDRFVVNMARQVKDNEIVVTGLASAVPMLAIELARRTHAPNLTYINCIGAVNPRFDTMPPTSVEAGLRSRCDRVIELPDLFDLARDGGVDSMFFGAAQIDVHGNINLCRIGPADAPKVRFAGPAGSPSMRSYIRRVLVAVPRQSTRNLVPHVDTVTSAPADRNEETVLVTDAAIWRLGPSGLEPRTLQPGVTLEDLSSRTGFELACGSLPTTKPPSTAELAALGAIDADGLRYRLLAGKHSSPANSNPTDPIEKVQHER